MSSQPHRGRLVAAAASLLAVALACGVAAPHEDPPPERVAYESVVGTWKGGLHTIEFHDDGTYTLTNDSGNFILLEDQGIWTLCEDYPYEAFSDGGSISIDCVEAETGEWVQIHRPVDQTIDFPLELIFTGDKELKLYAYNIDTGVDRDIFYHKAD